MHCDRQNRFNTGNLLTKTAHYFFLLLPQVQSNKNVSSLKGHKRKRRDMFVENQFITHSVSFNGELVNGYIYLSNAYYIAGATLAQHEGAGPSDLVIAHNNSDLFLDLAHSSNKGPQKFTI